MAGVVRILTSLCFVFTRVSLRFGALFFALLLSSTVLGSLSRFVPFSSSALLAKADSSVEILGIRVPCEDCQLKGGQRCSVVFAGSKRELPCEQALRELLDLSLAKNSELELSTEELRRALFREDVSQEIANRALIALSRTMSGRERLVFDFPALAESKPTLLEHYLGTTEVPQEVLDAISHLPRRKSSELLRGLAVAVDSKREPSTLLEDLPAVDVKNDKEDLLLYSQALKEKKPEWSRDFLSLAGILGDCELARDSEFSARCLERTLPERLEKGQKYFLRLKTQLTLQRIALSEASEHQKLLWFAKLDCGRYRTPESLKQIRGLLTAILQEPFGKQQEFLESLQGNFLKSCSRHDKEISSLAALLYVKYASGLWELGGKRESTKALLTSYELFPEFLEARTSFVETVSLELPREERWFQEAWEKLSDEAQHELSWSPSHTTEIIVAVVLGALFLLLLIAAAYYFFRRNERASYEDDEEERSGDLRPHISLESAEELRHLLEFFELKPPIKVHELTRRYRQKAKILHPDTVSGSSKEFTELTDKYQRAKELLSQISPLSGGQGAASPGNEA